MIRVEKSVRGWNFLKYWNGTAWYSYWVPVSARRVAEALLAREGRRQAHVHLRRHHRKAGPK